MKLVDFQRRLKEFENTECTMAFEDGTNKVIDIMEVRFDDYSNLTFCYMKTSVGDIVVRGVHQDVQSKSGKERHVTRTYARFADKTVVSIRHDRNTYIFGTEMQQLPSDPRENKWSIRGIPKGKILYRVADIDSPWKTITFFTNKFTHDYFNSVKLATDSEVKKKIYTVKAKRDFEVVRIAVWREDVYGVQLDIDRGQIEHDLMEACKSAGTKGWSARVRDDNLKAHDNIEIASWELAVVDAEELFEIVEKQSIENFTFADNVSMKLRF